MDYVLLCCACPYQFLSCLVSQLLKTPLTSDSVPHAFPIPPGMILSSGSMNIISVALTKPLTIRLTNLGGSPAAIWCKTLRTFLQLGFSLRLCIHILPVLPRACIYSWFVNIMQMSVNSLTVVGIKDISFFFPGCLLCTEEKKKKKKGKGQSVLVGFLLDSPVCLQLITLLSSRLLRTDRLFYFFQELGWLLLGSFYLFLSLFFKGSIMCILFLHFGISFISHYISAIIPNTYADVSAS